MSGIGRTPDLALSLGELAGILALGQDNASGQPLESQFRSTLPAVWLAEAAGLPAQVRDTAYWACPLRYVGCTGHAHEVAVMFGDEIEARSRTLRYDAANPVDVLRDVVAHGLPGRRGPGRIGAVVSILAGGRRFAQMNFRAGCEVADAIAAGLDMPVPVREALACTFERRNGRGQPNKVKGEQIPLPMRIVHLTHDAEALDRLCPREEAVRMITARSGRSYDPALVAAFTKVADELFGRLGKADPWEAVVALEPAPREVLSGHALDRALAVAADFTDLKSPYTAGHSRQVADLTAAACEHAGPGRDEVTAARRAALVHDLGRTAIPNSIWDKPGPLTRAEFDRVELHPLLTEQMLRRSPWLAGLGQVAACHHEKADGTGYVKGLTASQMSMPARILGAADRFCAITQPRAHRPALTQAAAAAELRRMAGEGQLDAESTGWVLSAAGQGQHGQGRPAAAALPAGLTAREAEVLRLAALGLTTKAIAERLVISAKTADSHIQHAYAKIGVSTRGAAALYAIRNGLVS